MGTYFIDLTNKKFGKWLVSKRAPNKETSKGSTTMWKCVCDCGTLRTVSSNNLINGSSKSCGCGKLPNEIGKKYGKWLVISVVKDETKKHNRIFCKCVCECGVEKMVNVNGLRNGASASCGCSYQNPLAGTKLQLMLHRAKGRAKRLKVPFNIEIKDIIVPEYCPVFPSIKLEYNGNLKYNSPTLDRINTKLGYVKGNIQVISWKANRLKSDATLKEMRNILIYMEKYEYLFKE